MSFELNKFKTKSLERNIRQRSPVLTPLTQFHGWWHILGAYYFALQTLFFIHSWYDFHKDKEEKRKLGVVGFGFSLEWQ